MKLSVQSRVATGKAVKKIRKEGYVPAVVYGKGIEGAISIKCPKNDFIRVYRASGYSTPIELTGDLDQLVLLHALQVDPVSDEVLSIDFLAVDKNEKVSADVPVVLVGESKIEKSNEGNIQLVKDTVSVEALPQDLPHSIEVDISAIETINDVIFVKDLTVPKNVKIIDDEEQPILTVVEIVEEEVEETTEAVATESEGSDA